MLRTAIKLNVFKNVHINTVQRLIV